MSTEVMRAPVATSTAAAHRGGGALSLGQMTPQEAWRFAEALADTPLLPDQYRRQPASVLWAMEYGRALGLDVVTTITTIHVIKGKPSQSADLMLSRARTAGHRVRIQSERTRCVVTIVRADDPDDENSIEWTLDDAVTAGLCEIRNGRPYSRSSKGEPQSWEKYPRAMLRARALSECVRMACPEVLHGAIYTPEELGARVDESGLPMEAEIQQLRSVPAGEPDQWQQPAHSQQTPPAVVAAGVADVPPESLTPAGRDYLHEAHAAPDMATVKQIYADAKAEGGVPEYLAQIAQVGVAKKKAAAEQQAAPGRVVAGEVMSAQEQAEAAEQELRTWAGRVGLPEIAADFEGAKGVPLSEATAEQIRGFLTELRGSAA
ncbi:recombinase RecT [Actinacidiphila sp. ITFR-21]|uniref:recombinase RecT n=1 Tax=Actinacidiphila sp. ITFR-21 TaxID=3075199 RepID=UPI002889CD5F|nr:recombinase RecT [Streptomyces sp. ITFR-21]WNI19129.1 hypothetical protein RLT57_28735 [Streptomyces sp. ITFR-21]